MGRASKVAMFLLLLTLPACGPLLDFTESIENSVTPVSLRRFGPMTGLGEIKRDFWGNSYIEPYPDSEKFELKLKKSETNATKD